MYRTLPFPLVVEDGEETGEIYIAGAPAADVGIHRRMTEIDARARSSTGEYRVVTEAEAIDAIFHAIHRLQTHGGLT